jgi:hypothetical protein
LSRQRFYTASHVTHGKLFHGSLQLRISLADDLVKFRGIHSGLLQLLERTASFDRLVLACISYKDDTILWAKTAQKITHLVGAGET